MIRFRHLLIRLFGAIQLTRLTLAFGAVSDLWFVVVLSRAEGAMPLAGLPLAASLGAALVVALGLYAFGAALNDLLDARHDVAFSPDRPIPAGRIRTGQAVVVTVGSLLAATVAASAFGQIGLLLAALTAAGLLFYDAAAKHVPAVGILVVGIVHALHMLVPNHALAFTIPVWLIMTHAIAIGIAVYRLEEKRPPISRRSIAALGVGYAIASAAILGLGAARGGLIPPGLSVAGMGWPLLAVVGFVVVARRKSIGVPGRIAAEKLRRYGAMWQSLYGAAWLAALGLTGWSIALVLLSLAGFAAMTLLKEINGLTGRPVAFRG